MSSKAVRVMLVDDSSLVRQALTEIIESDPDMEVIATAQDPFIAAKKMKEHVPDVLVLDVEMPRMDGITFLRKIMQQRPIPTVICSTLVGEGTDTLMKALEAGAVEVIQKPKLGTRKFIEESQIQITDTIKAAAKARPRKLTANLVRPRQKLSADAIISAPGSRAMAETTEKVVVIGSSTGGTEAISEILERMPLGCPGIVIVQHMPEGFTKSFAQRLNGQCEIEVKEAQHGDSVLRGQALIAPGGRHLLLKRSGARYFVEIKDGPLVTRHRPSVDVLFRSAARYAGKNTVAVILTGMGDDGAQGMKELFDAGAMTYAQDEATSVVYGMPKEAVARGGVHKSLSLEAVPAALLWASS